MRDKSPDNSVSVFGDIKSTLMDGSDGVVLHYLYILWFYCAVRMSFGRRSEKSTSWFGPEGPEGCRLQL